MITKDLDKLIKFSAIASFLENDGVNPDDFLTKEQLEELKAFNRSVSTPTQAEATFRARTLFAEAIKEVFEQ